MGESHWEALDWGKGEYAHCKVLVLTGVVGHFPRRVPGAAEWHAAAQLSASMTIRYPDHQVLRRWKRILVMLS